MTRKRTLTAEERQLWRRLARTVRPADGKRAEEPVMEDGPSTDKPSLSERLAVTKVKSRPAATQRGLIKAHSAPRSQPQPAMEAGDPRQARHVSRGRRAIDATLDLHGMTQDQAFAALSRFLDQARAMQLSTLLIITGKGAPDAMEQPGYAVSRGILRRRFLDWVDGPFKEHIAAIRQSHQKHGGSGAFYVFLRKRT